MRKLPSARRKSGGKITVPILSGVFLLAILSFHAPAGQEGNHEDEVRFSNGSDVLAGTLFWPAERAECPAVVILAGSDRSARGPLRSAIAKHFAAHGAAALVYDSPGTGASSGNAILQGSDDRVAEALSAVSFLRRMKGIRSTAVGIFGGSEGANIALLACAKDPGVAFVISVSGSLGVPVLDILRYSAEKSGYESGLNPEEVAQAVTFKEVAFVLLSGADIVEWPLIESRVKRWEDDAWRKLIDIVKDRQKNMNKQQKAAFLDNFKSIVLRFETRKWFVIADATGGVRRMSRLGAEAFFNLLDSGRFSRDWDRGLCFNGADIRCPVLAIWGEEDSFLPPRQSAARLKKRLLESKHPDFEVIVFPGAGHFLTVSGSTTDFVPGYLDTLATWVQKRFDSGDDSGLSF